MIEWYLVRRAGCCAPRIVGIADPALVSLECWLSGPQRGAENDDNAITSMEKKIHTLSLFNTERWGDRLRVRSDGPASVLRPVAAAVMMAMMYFLL